MDEVLFGLKTRADVNIPLKGVKVSGTIAGRSARINVVQHFRNTATEPLEAIYKFPLPENSSVCGFCVKKEGVVYESEIKERNEAFEEYDKALSKGDGAYLLDQERPNIFTLSAGNINPGSSLSIEITYVTLLDTDGTETRFFLPTTISPRYIPENTKDKDGIPVDSIVNPPFAIDVPYGLKLSLDIQGKDNISSIESPSHPIAVSYHDNHISIEFAAETAVMDRDFILTINYKEGYEKRAYYLNSDTEGFIQVDFTCKNEDVLPKDTDSVQPMKKEVIFVLDCSGSMSGSSITEANKAIEIFLKALDAETLFNIYRFGSNFEKLFQKSLPYTDDSLKKALSYIKNTQADLGGTEMLAPLKDIYKTSIPTGFNRAIILITDGEIGNEPDILALVKGGSDKTRVFTVGIGNGPNEYLIKQIARSSYGASELVSPGERIEPRVLRLFRKVQSEETNNIKIKIKWGKKIIQAPADPVAYPGETITVFGKTKHIKGLKGKITVTGNIKGQERRWHIDISKIEGDDTPIPVLWAREMIRELEEGGSSSGSKQTQRKEAKLKDEIVNLSKKYCLLSRETSFVTIEKRIEKDKTVGEARLIKIPVKVTKDWHGIKFMKRSTGYDAPCLLKISAPKIEYHKALFTEDLHQSFPDYKEKIREVERRIYDIWDNEIESHMRRFIGELDRSINEIEKKSEDTFQDLLGRIKSDSYDLERILTKYPLQTGYEVQEIKHLLSEYRHAIESWFHENQKIIKTAKEYLMRIQDSILHDLPETRTHFIQRVSTIQQRLDKEINTMKLHKATIPQENDILLKILSLQKHSGGFETDDELATMLGLSMEELKKTAAKMHTQSDGDRRR